MADPKELAARLDRLCRGTTEWRVADPHTGNYCIQFDREHEAREWLRDHRQRFPGSMFAGYEVREVTWYSELEQAALEATDFLNAAGVPETFQGQGPGSGRDTSAGSIPPSVTSISDGTLRALAHGMPRQPWGIGSRQEDAFAFARAVLAASDMQPAGMPQGNSLGEQS